MIAPVKPEDLAPDERAWLERSERLWAKAHELHARHPHLDVSGLYHTLGNIERTPAERLRRSLRFGRGMAAAARALRGE